MPSSKENDGPKFTLWMDPFSEKIVVETPDYIFRAPSLAHVRGYACSLLEEANKLEHQLAISKRGTHKRRKIGKNYGNKVIQEWEQLLAHPTDSVDDSNQYDIGS